MVKYKVSGGDIENLKSLHKELHCINLYSGSLNFNLPKTV